MEVISLESSSTTPSVLLDAKKGKLEIKGRSIPENSIDFYKPIIDWINQYTKDSRDRTVVNIELEYFNTSSSKCILDIFKKLELIYKEGKTVELNWFFKEDDLDILEAGEDYQFIVKIPIHLVEVRED